MLHVRTNGTQYEKMVSSSDSESETSLRPEDIESDAGQVIEANHHHQHHQTNNIEEQRLSQGNEIFSTDDLVV